MGGARPSSWIAFLLALLWGTGARAEVVVALHESPGLRPGLCTALRIQLADAGTVTCRSERTSTPLVERVSEASSEVQRGEARLVLLLERDPDVRLVRMYIVGGRADQAVIALERVQDRPEPDVDRSLALEARAALDALDVMEAAQPKVQPRDGVEPTDGAQTTEAAVTRPASLAGVLARAPDAQASNSGPFSGALEVGGGAAFGGEARGFGQVWLLARRSFGVLRAELGPSARWFSSVHARQPQGSVEESEWAAGLGLRGVWALAQRVELGLSLEPAWSVMQARGTTESGRRGARREGRFTSSVGLDVRVRLASQLYMRCAPALELASLEQRFAVDQGVVLTLPRQRFLLPISLGVGWP